MDRQAYRKGLIALTVCILSLTGCAPKREKVQRHETKKREQTRRTVPVVPRARLAGISSMVSAAAIGQSAGELEIHFIDVGQGDSTLIKCPNGDTVLIDCGSTEDFEEEDVRAYLRDQLGSDSHIDVLVITHPDADHYNKVERVLEARNSEPAISVSELKYVISMASHDQRDFDEWMKDFSGQKERMFSSTYNVYPPQSIDVCGDAVDVQVLAANVWTPDEDLKPNTASIVLLIRMGEFEAVLTGDATFVTQENILKRFESHENELATVEVLKVAHHGSRHTSMVNPPHELRSKWFDAIEPFVAIFSAAYGTNHGHPNADLAAALKDHTLSAESHPVRFWDKKGDPSSAGTNHLYENEAMFMSGTNHNIVITSDGETFAWLLDQ